MLFSQKFLRTFWGVYFCIQSAPNFLNISLRLFCSINKVIVIIQDNYTFCSIILCSCISSLLALRISSSSRALLIVCVISRSTCLASFTNPMIFKNILTAFSLTACGADLSSSISLNTLITLVSLTSCSINASRNGCNITDLARSVLFCIRSFMVYGFVYLLFFRRDCS